MLTIFAITCLARIASAAIEFELERIEQIGAEHVLESSGVRVRKYNRTLSVLDGTFSLLKDLDDSFEISLSLARSALGNNQFNEYPMKIPRKDCCKILLDDYAEYQHVWANDTNLPQIDKKAPPALCAIPKGNYWMKNFAPDASWIPPVIPEGFWRMTWYLFEKSSDVKGQVRLFVRIKKNIL